MIVETVSSFAEMFPFCDDKFTSAVQDENCADFRLCEVSSLA